ncbi:MAG TPA: NINE protein [Dongiaceae bacterium]|nr:NINE protein [Dongiaceae bacterium]
MSPICPYCRTEIGDAEGERKDCPGCGTPHHADCFAENGGCTVFGCTEAPTDEAKVTVTATDMAGNTVTRQVTPPAPRATPLSLGPGMTTFRAPVPLPAPAEPTPAPSSPASTGPTPPPPPPGGTGIAPPPQLGPGPQAGAPGPAPLVYYVPPPQPKARVIFVLLGIFLGAVGVHNFYAGYAKKGAIQLCISLLTCFYGAPISWIWAIIEICVVNRDADGTQFV